MTQASRVAPAGPGGLVPVFLWRSRTQSIGEVVPETSFYIGELVPKTKFPAGELVPCALVNSYLKLNFTQENSYPKRW